MTQQPEQPELSIEATIEATEETPLWERLLDADGNFLESAKAYDGFCAYRNMGIGQRSHTAVNAVLYGEDVNNVRHIAEWSRTFRWVERVEAWEAHKDELRRARNLKRQIEVEEFAYLDYLFLRGEIRKAIDNYQQSPKTAISDVRALLGLMHEADDYARRAVGLPDKITQNRNTIAGEMKVTASLADEMADIFKEMSEYEAQNGGGDETAPSG